MNRVAILLLAFVAAIGCGPSGQNAGQSGKQTKVVSAVAKSAAELMPVAEGNAWTYHIEDEIVGVTVQQQRRILERTLKVAKVTRTDAGAQVLIEVLDQDGKVVLSFTLRVNDSGVYQLTGPTPPNGQALQFDPPMPWVIWGAKLDQTTDWSGTGPLPGVSKDGPVKGSMKGGLMYKGEAEVDGMHERFKTMRFDSAQTYTHDGKQMRAVQVVWYAPQVGIVRMMEGISDGQIQRSSNWRVKSYTVK